jgi:hypothetical protein
MRREEEGEWARITTRSLKFQQGLNANLHTRIWLLISTRARHGETVQDCGGGFQTGGMGYSGLVYTSLR